LLRGLGLLAAGTALGLGVPQSATAAADVADGGLASRKPGAARKALERLAEGNRRFVTGEMIHPHQDVERRLKVVAGQKPFAQVFSCIDSRVPPEVVFDQGLGDLFVIRTGAQTLDELVQGSVEFGPLKYGTPLVVVMGHQHCGAVAAAVESLGHGTDLGPRLNRIVTALKPAYDAAKASGVPEDELVDATIRQQTALTVKALEADQRLTPLISQGRLLIEGAYYSLDTGKVTWSHPDNRHKRRDRACSGRPSRRARVAC
jgi:carbonic anhydrase